MSLGGEDEFFKFIKFYEEGKVGTLIRLWNKFNKIYNDLSGEGKYQLNLFKFNFFFFLTGYLLKFLDTSQGGDIHLNFYILHIDKLISECSRIEIIIPIIFLT